MLFWLLSGQGSGPRPGELVLSQPGTSFLQPVLCMPVSPPVSQGTPSPFKHGAAAEPLNCTPIHHPSHHLGAAFQAGGLRSEPSALVTEGEGSVPCPLLSLAGWSWGLSPLRASSSALACRSQWETASARLPGAEELALLRAALGAVCSPVPGRRGMREDGHRPGTPTASSACPTSRCHPQKDAATISEGVRNGRVLGEGWSYCHLLHGRSLSPER